MFHDIRLLAAAVAAATWQAADAVVDAIASWRHHWSLTDSPSNCQYFHSTVSAAQHLQLTSHSSFVCSACNNGKYFRFIFLFIIGSLHYVIGLLAAKYETQWILVGSIRMLFNFSVLTIFCTMLFTSTLDNLLSRDLLNKIAIYYVVYTFVCKQLANRMILIQRVINSIFVNSNAVLSILISMGTTDQRRQATPTQMTIRQRATPVHDTVNINNIAENKRWLSS